MAGAEGTQNRPGFSTSYHSPKRTRVGALGHKKEHTTAHSLPLGCTANLRSSLGAVLRLKSADKHREMAESGDQQGGNVRLATKQKGGVKETVRYMHVSTAHWRTPEEQCLKLLCELFPYRHPAPAV